LRVYYNSDKKTNKLFKFKHETDKSFNDAIKLFNLKNNHKHHMVVASHNNESLNIIKDLSHPNISIAHLLGFSDELSIEFAKKGYNVYKYLPFGYYNDTLPYLTRRLYENYPILMHL
jgi:proline dehydrogenase